MSFAFASCWVHYTLHRPNDWLSSQYEWWICFLCLLVWHRISVWNALILRQWWKFWMFSVDYQVACFLSFLHPHFNPSNHFGETVIFSPHLLWPRQNSANNQCQINNLKLFCCWQLVLYYWSDRLNALFTIDSNVAAYWDDVVDILILLFRLLSGSQLYAERWVSHTVLSREKQGKDVWLYFFFTLVQGLLSKSLAGS